MTGHEAQRAHKKGDALEKSVDELGAQIKKDIADSKSPNKSTVNLGQLSKQICALNDEINQSQIAYWRKDKFRVELDKLKKLLIDLDKENKAQLLAASIDECKTFVEASKEAKWVVREFKVGGEAKSLNEILKTLRQHLADACILIYSVDELNGKVTFLSSVPDVS